MSTNYKHTDVVGESWVRAFQVLCNNPFEGERTITFREEQIINTGVDRISRGVGAVSTALTEENALHAFPILNPLTGQPVGNMTYQEVLAILHSLYFHLAQQRDLAEASEDPTPDPEQPELPIE